MCLARTPDVSIMSTIVTESVIYQSAGFIRHTMYLWAM